MASLIGAISFDYRRVSRSSVSVSIASCLADDDGVELLCAFGWICPMPDPNRYIEGPHGTYETIGLLGGVLQRLAAAQSEAVERAISDGLTLALAQMLDLEQGSKLIIIPGPPFPKSVGRFLSLRPPQNTIIAWVSSSGNDDNLPHNKSVALPRRFTALRGEGLITSIPFDKNKLHCWIEYIDVDGSIARQNMVTKTLNQLRPPIVEKKDSLPRNLEFAFRALPPIKSSNYFGPSASPPDWFNKNIPTELVEQPTMSSGLGRNRVIYPWRRTA